jgi:hypothetical protein
MYPAEFERTVATRRVATATGAFECSIEPEAAWLTAEGLRTVNSRCGNHATTELPASLRKNIGLEARVSREPEPAAHIAEIGESNGPNDDEHPLALLGPYITFPQFDYRSRCPGKTQELIPQCGLGEETGRK